MNNIKQAIDYAFSDKVADMQQELVNAVSVKVANALEAKRMEIAQDLLNTNEEIEDLEELSKDTLGSYVKKAKKTLPSLHGRDPYGYQKRDKNIDKAVDKLTKEEAEELEEKLSVSDGVDAWIKDFVHSDDPRFDGKSKKERINQALAAFYAAKKGQ